MNIPPASKTPGPDWPNPEPPSKAKSILSFIKALSYHLWLTLIKVVAVPIELSVLTVAESSRVICTLFERKRVTENPKTSDHLASICNEVKKVIGITLKYGIVRKGEELQDVETADGPQFVRIEPKSNQNGTPILYAPGYLDTPETLKSTCRRIADAHGGPVYIVKYRSLFQSIDEHAKDVEDLANRIKNDTHCDSLVLIGHSMGGLVTGRFIENVPNTKVSCWITIATPLKGTKIAHLGIGTCAKEMRPNSVWMQQFQKNDHTLQNTPSLHICTKTDHIVNYTSSYQEANSFVCPEPYGHISIRDNEMIEDKIIETLKNVAKGAD